MTHLPPLHQTPLIALSMKLVKSKLKMINKKTYLHFQKSTVLTQMTVLKSMKLKVCGMPCVIYCISFSAHILKLTSCFTKELNLKRQVEKI